MFPNNKVLENLIHHCLEGCCAISEAKHHYQSFKESKVRLKGCLPLVPFFDPNILVPPVHI
jgi:hypothetical protein